MLYFAHIPKCGGTTIKQLFYSAVGIENCIKVWDRNFGADFSETDFASLGADVLRGKKAIVGHLKFQQALQNKHLRTLHENGNLHTVSVVRHPLDRQMSLFNYVRAKKDHPGHLRVSKMGFEEFATNQQANFQLNFLRSHEGEPVASIFSRMSVYPIEHSEELVRRWLERMTNQRVKPMQKLNITSATYPDMVPYKSSDLKPSHVAAMRRKHNLDYELYTYSRRIQAEPVPSQR